MSYYELFQQGPMVYIPILLISLAITLLAYAAFPIILAKTRCKTITKKKYNILCYGINFLIMLVFIVLNGKASGAPYIIWTGVFSSLGLRILKNQGVLDGFQSIGVERDLQIKDDQVSILKIKFCRKCGNELLDGAKFCNMCGTEMIKED